MYWILAIMTASLLGIVGTGIYLELRPTIRPRRIPWMRGAVLGNLAIFFLAEVGLLFLGINDAMAQHAAEAGAGDAGAKTRVPRQQGAGAAGELFKVFGAQIKFCYGIKGSTAQRRSRHNGCLLLVAARRRLPSLHIR